MSPRFACACRRGMDASLFGFYPTHNAPEGCKGSTGDQPGICTDASLVPASLGFFVPFKFFRLCFEKTLLFRCLYFGFVPFEGLDILGF